MSDLIVEFEAQRGWVDLPVNPELELDDWCSKRTEEVVQLFAVDGEEANPKTIFSDLQEHAKDARVREPQSSFAFFGSGINKVLAVLDVEVLKPSTEMPKLDISEFIKILSTDELVEPEVKRVELPLGHAARIRQNILGERKWKLGPRSVLHTLIYCVRPNEQDRMIIIRSSWTTAIIDELMTQNVDDIATSLTCRRIPEED